MSLDCIYWLRCGCGAHRQLVKRLRKCPDCGAKLSLSPIRFLEAEKPFTPRDVEYVKLACGCILDKKSGVGQPCYAEWRNDKQNLALHEAENKAFQEKYKPNYSLAFPLTTERMRKDGV